MEDPNPQPSALTELQRALGGHEELDREPGALQALGEKTSRRGNISKGDPYGRLLRSERDASGRLWDFHATKGWRKRGRG